jgi:hypothetical protein
VSLVSCLHSFFMFSSCLTSHQFFRCSTQGINTLAPTMRTTHHPLWLWSKSYLYKPKCFKLYNKWWPICIKAKVTNRHHNLIPVTSLASFRGPSHQHFHTLLNQWMPMTGLKLLKRNFKSCSATTERWSCLPHTSLRDLHPSGGMHMLMHMRSPLA